MSGSQSLTPYEPDAYDAIAHAMAESARGRWFLAEHARRNRGSDTGTVLDAIARLENAVRETAATGPRPLDDIEHLRGNLLDMANAISRTKAEIAAISAPGQDQSRLGSASEALDAIVRTTERATTDILGAAEEVQEAAWLLRERGIEPEFCDRLDRHATQIYTACSFQDLTAQRTGRIVHTLRYLEDRLSAMIAIWDAEGERVPPAPGRAEAAAELCQSDVDRFIGAEAPSLPALPLLGATALDDDLAFAAPDAPGSAAAALAEPVLGAAPEAEVGGEVEEMAFDAFGPAAELPAETAERAPPDTETLDTETLDTETRDIAAVEIEPAEIAAETVPDTALAEPDSARDEAILETADALTFDAAPVLDPAEPRETVAEAAEPVPGHEDEPRQAAPARLDDIDLLTIEEKLALFS